MVSKTLTGREAHSRSKQYSFLLKTPLTEKSSKQCCKQESRYSGDFDHNIDGNFRGNQSLLTHTYLLYRKLGNFRIVSRSILCC